MLSCVAVFTIRSPSPPGNRASPGVIDVVCNKERRAPKKIGYNECLEGQPVQKWPESASNDERNGGPAWRDDGKRRQKINFKCLPALSSHTTSSPIPRPRAVRVWCCRSTRLARTVAPLAAHEHRNFARKRSPTGHRASAGRPSLHTAAREHDAHPRGYPYLRMSRELGRCRVGPARRPGAAHGHKAATFWWTAGSWSLACERW